MLLPPCPSCGTRLAVSDTAMPAEIKCPRCDTDLRALAKRPSSTRRAAAVVLAFAVCLALPLALCLTLMLSETTTAAPEAVVQPQPEERLARHDDDATTQLANRLELIGREWLANETDLALNLMPVELAPKTSAPKEGLLDTLPETLPPIVTLVPPTREKDKLLLTPATPGLGGSLGTPIDPKTGQIQITTPVDPKTKEPVPKGQLLIPPGFQVPVKPVGQTITFMGVPGTGRRFCYIVDCSGSMRGPPLMAVKAEAIRSLQSIRPDCEFFVIFFNSSAGAQPTPVWLKGVLGLPLVVPWIQSLQGGGFTNPVSAFEIAFALNPRPDAIFFLTDGVVTVGTPQQAVQSINGMNAQGPPVPIHSILFSHTNPIRPSRNAKNAAEQMQRMVQEMQRQIQEMKIAAEVLQRISYPSGGTFSAITVPPSLTAVRLPGGPPRGGKKR